MKKNIVTILLAMLVLSSLSYSQSQFYRPYMLSDSSKTSKMTLYSNNAADGPFFNIYNNNSITNILKIGIIKSGSYYYPGVWYNQSTPNASNYSMLFYQDALEFNINSAPIYFNIGGYTKLAIVNDPVGFIGIGTVTPSHHLSIRTDSSSGFALSHKYWNKTGGTTAQVEDTAAIFMKFVGKDWYIIQTDTTGKRDTVAMRSYAREQGGGGTWGSITGTISNQTDLQDSLDNRLKNSAVVDSINEYAIGVGTMARGQRLYAGSADSIYSRRDTLEIFIFGGGGGNAGDTASFTTSTYYGSFKNGIDTLVITSLNCVMSHGIGTDTLQVQVFWDDTLGANDAITLNTSPLPINSITTGTVDTSFDNATIPPGVRVWMKTPVVVTGRKPTYLECTLTGYVIHK